MYFVYNLRQCVLIRYEHIAWLAALSSPHYACRLKLVHKSARAVISY